MEEHERFISWVLNGLHTVEFDFVTQDLRLSWSGDQTFLRYSEMLMLRDFINAVLAKQEEYMNASIQAAIGRVR